VSKKPIIGGIILAAIIGVVFVGAQINPDNPENEEVVFHAILADPALYDEGGRYYDTVFLEKGIYEFRFVPNGDSPQKLWVWLKPAGEKLGMFSQKYVLVGNLVEKGMSSWYTWEYQIDPGHDYYADRRVCESCVSIDKWEVGQARITIDALKGDVNGSVSIELVQIEKWK
jgi:hypothetical protein